MRWRELDARWSTDGREPPSFAEIGLAEIALSEIDGQNRKSAVR
jgi:hypothetical protein